MKTVVFAALDKDLRLDIDMLRWHDYLLGLHWCQSTASASASRVSRPGAVLRKDATAPPIGPSTCEAYTLSFKNDGGAGPLVDLETHAAYTERKRNAVAKLTEIVERRNGAPPCCMRCQRQIPSPAEERWLKILLRNPAVLKCPHGPFCDVCAIQMFRNAIPFCHGCCAQASGVAPALSELDTLMDCLLDEHAGTKQRQSSENRVAPPALARAADSSDSVDRPRCNIEPTREVDGKTDTSSPPSEPKNRQWTPDRVAGIISSRAHLRDIPPPLRPLVIDDLVRKSGGPLRFVANVLEERVAPILLGKLRDFGALREMKAECEDAVIASTPTAFGAEQSGDRTNEGDARRQHTVGVDDGSSNGACSSSGSKAKNGSVCAFASSPQEGGKADDPPRDEAVKRLRECQGGRRRSSCGKSNGAATKQDVQEDDADGSRATATTGGDTTSGASSATSLDAMDRASNSQPEALLHKAKRRRV